MLGKSDNLERGESLFRRTLEIHRRTRGEEHDLTLKAMGGLAAIYGRRSKNEERHKLHERVLDVRLKTSGPSVRESLVAKHNLGLSFMDAGKLTEAEPLLREAVEAEVKNEPDHPGTLK